MTRMKIRIAVLLLAALACERLQHPQEVRAQDPGARRARRRAVDRDRRRRSIRRPRRCRWPCRRRSPTPNWAQPGGNAVQVDRPSRARHRARPGVQRVDRRGQQPDRAPRAPPVVGGGRVYTIDTNATVRAFDAANRRQGAGRAQFGDREGQQRLAVRRRRRLRQRPHLRDQRPRLRRRAGRRATAVSVWQVRPGGPLRGAPTVAGDALYVMSQDNQIYSLKTADGTTNWSNAAALEIAGVFGTGLAGLRAGHGGRRLLVGRAQRLSLRERPPGVAGRAGADQHHDQRVVAVATSTPIR